MEEDVVVFFNFFAGLVVRGHFRGFGWVVYAIWVGGGGLWRPYGACGWLGWGSSAARWANLWRASGAGVAGTGELSGAVGARGKGAGLKPDVCEIRDEVKRAQTEICATES